MKSRTYIFINSHSKGYYSSVATQLNTTRRLKWKM